MSKHIDNKFFKAPHIFFKSTIQKLPSQDGNNCANNKVNHKEEILKSKLNTFNLESSNITSITNSQNTKLINTDLKLFKSNNNKTIENEKKKIETDDYINKTFKTIDYINQNYSNFHNSISPKLKTENQTLQTECTRLFTPTNNKTNLFLKSNKSANLKSRNISYKTIIDKTLSLKSVTSTKKKDMLIISGSPARSKTDLRDFQSVVINNEKANTTFDVNEIYNIFSRNFEQKKDFCMILYKTIINIASSLSLIDNRFSTIIEKINKLWKTEYDKLHTIKEENERLKEHILYYENTFEEVRKSIEEKYYNENEELKHKIATLEDNIRKLNSLKKSSELTSSDIKNTHQSVEISIYNPQPKESSTKEINIVPKLDLRNLPKNDFLDTSKANNMANQLTTLTNHAIINNNENNIYKRNIKLVSKSTEKNKSIKANINIQFDNKKAIKNIKNLIKNDCSINFFNKQNQGENLKGNSILKGINHKRVLTESKFIEFFSNPPIIVKSRNQNSFNIFNNTESQTTQNKNFTMQI